MATVRQRKRDMVDAQIANHLENYKTSGADLIMGSGRFVAPSTLQVRLNDGGTACWRATRCSSTSERTR
jgi:pyruvate/2-oxoglutarate dehydrogenase complex dihydrolipoamide dehydrogenase (E3) component